MAKLSERDRTRLALFVVEMVRQRTHRGWSQAELAQTAKYSRGLIGAVETYERSPTDGLAKALDKAFDLPGTFQRLYTAVRGSAFPAAFGEFAFYEAEAVTLMVFEHAYAPGLLQTENYARAVLSRHYEATPEQVDERVKLRLGRQKVLSREDPAPPVLWVIVDEMALLREIGGPDVMAEQCAYLAEMAQRSGISVLIIPRSAGAHPGLDGMFHIAELRDGGTILFSGDIKDGNITDDPATVAEVTQRWRYLSSLTLSADGSLALMQERAKAWKTAAAAPGGKRLTAVPAADRASKSGSRAE